MARDGRCDGTLDQLSDAEIARIEGAVFCAGGPPETLTLALLARAAARRSPNAAARPA